MTAAKELNVIEHREPDGTLLATYGRRWDPRGAWVRHGHYAGYYPNGVVRTEGKYENGREEGIWRDYHDNGWIACVGSYHLGLEQGLWRFFDREGNEGKMVLYRDGAVVDFTAAE